MGSVTAGAGVPDSLSEKNLSDSYYRFFFSWLLYVVSELIRLRGYDFQDHYFQLERDYLLTPS